MSKGKRAKSWAIKLKGLILIIAVTLLTGCVPEVTPVWKEAGKIEIKKANQNQGEKPIWPVIGQDEKVVLKYYGFDLNDFSDAVILKTKPGADVVAVLSGTVTHIGPQEITIDSSLLTITYQNLARVLVGEGSWIKQGQRIGIAGSILALKGTQRGTSLDLVSFLWPDLFLQRVSVDMVVGEDLKKIFREVGETTGLDPELLEAIGIVESGLNPKAVSPKGAQGIMQLMPETAKALGVKDPGNPVENIRAGAEHLKALLEKYHDLELALAAYNAGEEAVDKHKGIPPYPETQGYVKSVMALYTKRKMAPILGLAVRPE